MIENPSDFLFRAAGEVDLIQCAPLARAGFINAFSTRRGDLSLGSSRREDRERIADNRRRFLSALGAEAYALVTARQIHSAEVCAVHRAPARGEAPTCDALESNLPRTLLAVQTADCLPILLADERTGAFAAVHAGWRGTLGRILARTLDRMQQDYGVRARDLRAAFGPSIGGCCFELGVEVLDAFRREFDGVEDLISNPRPGGKAHLDLNRLNARELVDCGLPPAHIYDSGLCTSCRHDLFFSYRRERGSERPVGRLMGVIGRES
jgi:YfiH family protein